jgi:NitT/TauT family transport system substrate-binding protein
MKAVWNFVFGSLLAGALIGGQAVARAEEPADIVYGYHPYWVGAWSGVIIKNKELWKKYLPAGSTVKFEPHLTGPPMISALLANKMQIGTMATMPALVATTKSKIADIRLVSVPTYSTGGLVKIMVRKDAPQFKDYKEAMKWLSGRPFAYHKGTDPHRFSELLIDQGIFKPSEVLSMPIEVISSNFEAGKLDAAVMWEPHARRQVELGNARYVATATPWKGGEVATFSLMRQEFIEKHPQAAAGWIKAEIEAIQFMVKYPKETAEILEKELTGYPTKTAWAALYEVNPPEIGGDPVNASGKMAFDKDVLGLMKSGYAFLFKLKVIESPDMPATAINDGPLKQAFKEMGLTAPVGEIRGMPRSAFR